MAKKTVVLITGSNSGIGEAVADYFHKSGNTIIPIDYNDNNVNKKWNTNLVDLCNETSVECFFKSLDHIDIAINCAGVSGSRKRIIDYAADEFVDEFSLNFKALLNPLKNELLIMKKQNHGNIINISSITAHKGMSNMSTYSTAKAAILNLTKVAAIEHHQNNIQVNSISPATIDTPLIRKKYNGTLKDYSKIYYTHNCGTTNDVVSVVKMLISNQFLTGSDVKLDGGITDLLKI